MAKLPPGIRKKPSGNFEVLVTKIHPRTGKKVYRRQTVKPPISREALISIKAQMATELEEEVNSTERRKRSENTTVADYSELWIRNRVRKKKASVQNHYIHALAEHILPIVGEIPVGELSRQDVIKWIDWTERQTRKDGQPYAQDTLRSWWRPFKTMLKDMAADYGLPDPTTRIEPPKSSVHGVREDRTLTERQLATLLETARSAFPEWFAEIYVMSYSGLRPSELYALKWSHVDFDKGKILVHRGVWQGHEGKNKTGKPREVAMPEPMKKILRDHRQKQLWDQHPGLEQGIVFPTDTGTYREASTLYKVLNQVAAVAGIDFKVGAQVLRRTFNTLLLEAGVNEVVLRSQMGHSSRKMTERYAGIHIERKTEAVLHLMKSTET